MSVLQVRSVVSTGQEALDTAVRDIALVQLDGGLYAYAATGSEGGLAGYALSEGQVARLADASPFPASLPVGLGGFVTPVALDGETRLLVGDGISAGMAGFVVDSASGAIGAMAPTDLAGTSAASAFSSAAALAGSDEVLLFAADTGVGMIGAYRLTSDGSSLGAQVSGGAGLAGTAPVLATLDRGGQEYLFTASPLDQSVTSYRVGAGGTTLELAGHTGAAQGLGIAAPTALAVAEASDGAYLLLGASGSSSISVMRITATGDLLPTDHVIDTLSTRFAHLQSLKCVVAGDRTYVVAGGGDDGLSLFTLLPGGKLLCLDSLADSADAGLANVSALAAAQVGQEVQILAASQSEAGLTQLAFSIADQGVVKTGGAGAETLTGGPGDDLIAGGAGDDRLAGWNGDDILVDGAGADTLLGGPGADIFVLAGDGARDRIADFTPGEDRLDLSGLAMFYDPSRLDITPTGTGAVLDWFGEILDLHRAGGGSISRAEVLAAIMEGPDRPLLSTGVDRAGTVGADHLTGGASGDALRGLAGRDLIEGGDGNDLLVGGSGHDTLHGGAGDDTVIGGNGRDRAFLEAGDDLFRDNGQDGAAGRDRVSGGAGADTIQGGGGNDIFNGQGGADRILGRLGDDRISGGGGHDRLDGGAGNDTVIGGNGRDRAVLGAGDDLFTDNGQGGGKGRDTVFAGPGADTIDGGAGADGFHGGGGADLIRGGTGADTLDGGAGRDTLVGGAGNDRLTGGAGADTFVFTAGGGHDRVVDFAPGTDHLSFTQPGLGFADLAIHDSALGAEIDTGAGTVVLVGLHAADLGAADFLFG